MEILLTFFKIEIWFYHQHHKVVHITEIRLYPSFRSLDVASYLKMPIQLGGSRDNIFWNGQSKKSQNINC